MAVVGKGRIHSDDYVHVSAYYYVHVICLFCKSRDFIELASLLKHMLGDTLAHSFVNFIEFISYQNKQIFDFKGS